MRLRKNEVYEKGYTMLTNMDKLTEHGCAGRKTDRVCRSRGGESCAFDGAMIVLQPIADTAHLVHGPIGCCGNSWEGRGSLSSKGELNRMGFTTSMNGMDIVYGSEEKLLEAIRETDAAVHPKAVFVHATCVSGLTGEDIEAVCRRASEELGIRAIPVNAPGFVGPKNLGNRIAGEVLLDHVIGTGELPEGESPDSTASFHFARKSGTGPLINLIGEYNIAGDLGLVEPILKRAGLRILSRITGDATFEEITYAHRAGLNVVVCGRALINAARAMEKKYGIPYVEVSFFGKTETAKALRAIAGAYCNTSLHSTLHNRVEAVIAEEEEALTKKLAPYSSLIGKKAVLYTGGVKSWSFISALRDLGIELTAVGTKKSTFEDEEKMKALLGPDAPLVEDVAAGNLLKLLKERKADMLIAGGRNLYLAVKEGYPFVDVNQERHVPYAGYDGLVNLAEQIGNGMRFYKNSRELKEKKAQATNAPTSSPCSAPARKHVLINPLGHSAAMGAAMAFQGIHSALPVIHGAQGCAFLGKVLLTKHFRDPIALAGDKLFTEDVVMGSDDALKRTVSGFNEKNKPAVIGVLTSGLSEVKGDDVSATVRRLRADMQYSGGAAVVHVPTPDYEGGLETGYARAVEEIIETLAGRASDHTYGSSHSCVNVLAGSHLTPADFTELRDIIEAFGLIPIFVPDLAALDGSRQGISPLALGGTTVNEIQMMGSAAFTLAVGLSLEKAARKLSDKFGVPYRVLNGLAGLRASGILMETLSELSGQPIPGRLERRRRAALDGLRDAHFFFGGKKVCLALEPDHAVQMSELIAETGATVELAVIPYLSASAAHIKAKRITGGDLFSIDGDFDLLVSNSHAVDTARRLETALYQTGFPVYKVIGNSAKVTIGYRGTLGIINEMANILTEEVHR